MIKLLCILATLIVVPIIMVETALFLTAIFLELKKKLK